MRRKMEKLAEQLDGKVMYFTENPFNFYGYEDCRYFICLQNTHKVYKAFRTQADAVEGLQELIEAGVVWEGSRGFEVVK